MLQYDIASQLESLNSYKHKLDRRVQGDQEQLQRETGLRNSLEQTQKALLHRIAETEGILEAERKQVGILGKAKREIPRF